MKKLIIRPEVKVGIAGLCAIFALVWGINFLKGKEIFRNKRTYYAVFSDLKGLPKSASVYISGLRVGNVDKIVYRDPSLKSFLIQFSINPDIEIPLDSYVHVYNVDLLGAKSLEIVIGNLPEKYVHKDTVRVDETDIDLLSQLMGEIAPIKKDVVTVLTHLDSILLAVNNVLDKEGQKNLTETLKNINVMSARFSTASVNIDNLLESEKNKISAILSNAESITKTLKNNSGKLTNIIENFSNISDTIAKANIAGTLNDVNASITTLSNLVNKIDKGKGNVGLLLNNDSLYYNLEKSSANLNALLEDVKANPKRYVKFSLF